MPFLVKEKEGTEFVEAPSKEQQTCAFHGPMERSIDKMDTKLNGLVVVAIINAIMSGAIVVMRFIKIM